MLEDIRNEILKELKDIGKAIEDDGLISIRHLFKILDKYKEKDDMAYEEYLEMNCKDCEERRYKNAWEELKTLAPQYFLCSRMEELEQKHNISKEME